MRYDEIFEKPIEEYTDEEIRSRALEMRSHAKLSRKKGGKKKAAAETSAELTETKGPTNKTTTMLERMINNAKLTKERKEGEGS